MRSTVRSQIACSRSNGPDLDRQWSRGDASDIDGQADRPSTRERASQSPIQDGIDQPRRKRASFYKMNMAAAAPNITIVVIPTMIRDNHELGWSCMILRSDATNRTPTSKNGASTPLMTAVQKSAFTGFTLRKS